VQQIDCMYAQGGTAYQQALVAAQNELQSFPASRQSYQDVIVFETDGAANTAPDSYFDPNSQQTVNGIPLYLPKPEHVYDVQHPCGSALDEANTIKSQGTVVLTVAYAVQQDDGCYEAPHLTTLTGNHWHGVSYKQVPEDTTAEQTLTAMASPNDAYSASNAATMSSAFASIANKIQSAALVPDSEGG
jgi:hypothetical protein